ncbi:UNVERIFIED_CONTAM: hypothetical protein FKN15_060238 [Acipenser sinensis]
MNLSNSKKKVKTWWYKLCRAAVQRITLRRHCVLPAELLGIRLFLLRSHQSLL